MSLPTELREYVAKPDAAYAVERIAEERLGRGTLYDLELTSLKWQGEDWKHWLQVFVPDQRTFADMALLTIGGAFGMPSYHRALGDLTMEATGTVCAFLSDVPNQPLFDGKIEDELIAHTLVQYLETGDAEWPLLLPMTKSAVRAMDAVQELLRVLDGDIPQRFVVTGMSKRGWTTWLTAVVDSRVAGIVPMVYDNLNLFAQMPHQREVWPAYSTQIGDYTAYDLPAKMQTPQGFHLAQIIDPYTYRDSLALPKLIMNGANDAYWATDALNLYWDGLAGPKNVLYIPNSGHGLTDPQRVASASLAFLKSVATGEPLPEFAEEFKSEGDILTCRIPVEAAASGGRLWFARSETLDFRPCVWESVPLRRDAEGWVGTLPLTGADCVAAFGEIDFPLESGSYSLSTQMEIVDQRGSAAQH